MTFSGGGSRAKKRTQREDYDLFGDRAATRVRKDRAILRDEPRYDSRRSTSTLRPVYSIGDVKKKAASCGSYFFDKDTMRFFNSRILSDVYNHAKDPRIAYFVTSEQGPHGPRAYTVRKQIGCKIKTASQFQEFSSAAAAKQAAKRRAAGKR